MWQWYDVEITTCAHDVVRAADQLRERRRGQELFDRQAPHRHDQARAQQLDLALEPRPTAFDLRQRRHTIAALRAFARKTAADRGHVHARTKLALIEAQ